MRSAVPQHASFETKHKKPNTRNLHFPYSPQQHDSHRNTTILATHRDFVKRIADGFRHRISRFHVDLLRGDEGQTNIAPATHKSRPGHQMRIPLADITITKRYQCGCRFSPDARNPNFASQHTVVPIERPKVENRWHVVHCRQAFTRFVVTSSRIGTIPPTQRQQQHSKRQRSKRQHARHVRPINTFCNDLRGAPRKKDATKKANNKQIHPDKVDLPRHCGTYGKFSNVVALEYVLEY